MTLCAFRIVQEAVQDALKHSRAENISIHLRGSFDGLVIGVNDGVGFVFDAAFVTASD